MNHFFTLLYHVSRLIMVMLVLGFAARSLSAQSTDPIPGGCGVVGPNLVLNPEFDQGNTLFTSNYQYHPGYICQFGQYTVAADVVVDPNVVCYGVPGFSLQTIWAVQDRNDPGTGNFMIIDPSEATGANDDVWSQTIPVCPGAQYTFSVFAKNVYFLEAPNYSGVDPNFAMEINGTPVTGFFIDGNPNSFVSYNLSRQPQADAAVWTQISGTWIAGPSETSANVVIRNLITGAQGNDLAIDGVFFGICGKSVGFNVTGALGQCPDDGPLSPVFLQPTPETNSSNWVYYEWVKDGNVILGEPTSSGTIPQYMVQPQANNAHFGTYQLRTYNGVPSSTNSLCGFSTTGGTTLFNSCEATFPVEWGPIEVSETDGYVSLSWSTLSELQNRGFGIEYAPEGEAFRNMGFVEGAGTTQDLQQYRFDVGELRPGRYIFRLRQVDFDGAYDFSPVSELEIAAPKPLSARLAPNPATGFSRLFLDVQEEQPVQVSLHTAMGQEVRVLHQGWVSPVGQDPIGMDVSDLARGMYFVRIVGTKGATTLPLQIN